MALVPFPSAKPGDDEDPDRQDDTGKMSFLEHLDELRTRLIHMIYGLIVGCILAYVFIGRIFNFLMRPLQQMLGPGDGVQRAVHIRGAAAGFLHQQRAGSHIPGF